MDAYRPLALTVPASTATRCQYWSWSEKVWTGLQWWPPDVTSKGWCQGYPWSPMSQGQAGVYSKFQCIMDNGHMGPPVDRHTHMSENITFPQLRWRVVVISDCYLLTNSISIVNFEYSNRTILIATLSYVFKQNYINSSTFLCRSWNLSHI